MVSIKRERLLDSLCDLDAIASDFERGDGCPEKQQALIMALRQVIKELEDLVHHGR